MLLKRLYDLKLAQASYLLGCPSTGEAIVVDPNRDIDQYLRAATDRPMGALTGDFIFVGDVGRPDLLERAAKVAGSMEESARSLFKSIQRFKHNPDYLQLWPGHGAGSACGKALGAVPSTTLGYERLFNWAFAIGDEAEFVHAGLAGQPEPPRYFPRRKTLNRDVQPVAADPLPPRQLEGR